MSHFKITSVEWESMKELSGDDYVFFHVIVVADDAPKGMMGFPMVLSFRSVMRQASREFPIIPTILKNARKQIKGWGPQESVLIGELEECGFNIIGLVKKAYESYLNPKKETTRHAMIKTDPESVGENVGEFHEFDPGKKEETENYYQLCELLESSISDAVIRQFPVLINSSPGCISELESILVNHIPFMAEDLIALIKRAKTDC